MQPESNPKNIESNTPNSGSKLSRLIDQYSLDELGNQLEDYWIAGSDDRYSLRELAEYVNHQLFGMVMDDAGMNLLDGEVENTYRLLIADDVSASTRTQTRQGLERADIDVEALEADFVSRQAIHTYLTKDRGMSYTATDDDPVAKGALVINGFKHRLTATVHSKVERLRKTNVVTLGEFEVPLDVHVLCEDCGAQY